MELLREESMGVWLADAEVRQPVPLDRRQCGGEVRRFVLVGRELDELSVQEHGVE